MRVRVLVVDDNPGFVGTAIRVLGGEGMTIVGTATTTAEALQRARETEPDVVLLDIVLGSESGFEVARQLAADVDAGRTRVILISTYAAEEFADLIASSPAIGFLPKSQLSARAIAEVLAEGDRADG
jgi:CheY-like chemotaxis protein